MIDSQTQDRLITLARQAMEQAHAPVTNFPVGAAVLTATGEMFAGCNTESIIAGVGVCAERSAVDHAVIHGRKDFLAVAVASRRPEPLFPCGVCRQYLYEFASASGRNPLILALGATGRIEQVMLSELLPRGFGALDR
jgi:cytidine deaminase